MLDVLLNNPPLLILITVISIIVYKMAFATVIVFEFQKALLYKKGIFRKYLEAGKHVYFRYAAEVKKVDIRPTMLAIKGQEIPSFDGVALKISAMVKYEIADPYKAVNSIQSYSDGIYNNVQSALRNVVCASNIDDLLEKRSEIGARLQEMCEKEMDEFGIKLISIEIKDIIFPGDLKKIFSNVVKARKEGQAILERARGETAALRNLANAAKMLENNPHLLKLRALQTVGETTGNTIVFGVGSDSNGSNEPKISEVVHQ